MAQLTLALIHAALQHKHPKRNRAELLRLFRRAGEQQAQLVLAPEMALAGYSFRDRRDIAPFCETKDGPTLEALSQLTRQFGFYACIGMAERCVHSGLFYNSALVLDPSGQLVCHYRKINAEHRWACAGNPYQDNTFTTPWGRMGVLICSDSYHSLMARVTARRGADLLLIPANWPPTGLEPREIWRARALENSCFIAACNRTGRDLTMDCRPSHSLVCDPKGRILLDGCHPDSQLFFAQLPLTDQHRLFDPQYKKRAPKAQGIDRYDCALNLGDRPDLTQLHQLPATGTLPLCCPVPLPGTSPLTLLPALEPEPGQDRQLILLPAWPYQDQELTALGHFARNTGCALYCCRQEQGDWRFFWFNGHQPGEQGLLPPATEQQVPLKDFGPARLVFLPPAVLGQPEVALAAAKQGADLGLLSLTALSPEQRLLAGARTIDNLALAASSPTGAGLWLPPQGHQRWQEYLIPPGDTGQLALDTACTRNKRFQDRIDFARLFQE